ncbi:MAG: M20/M25/M40 family metallo-hydrolase [Candidatus Marsarchaeota archaeon]|nr:M20/M25/M40 family metallo-hydrolase [Candidatus Marsarchaeota archaeon]
METVRLLSKLVGINSAYPEEKRLGEFVNSYLKQNNFSVTLQQVEKNRFNILAEKGKGRTSTLFLGHLDTVKHSSLWTTNPLKLAIKGDKMYGLGSYDMKGGMAAMIKAAESSDSHIKLLICVDEENISKGAWKAVTERKKWFKDVSIALSPEPSLGSGSNENTILVGRGGRVVVCVDVIGKASHQAHAEEGINAIESASIIISNIKKMRLKSHKNLGKEFAFVREVSGASNGLSIPENAHFEIDIRMVPPSKPSDMINSINDLINSLKSNGILNKNLGTNIYIKRRETPYLLPYEINLGSSPVKAALSTIKKFYKNVEFGYGRSVSDENVIASALNIPVLRVGPKGGNAHAANEWVSKKSIKDLSLLYAAIADSQRN